MGFTLTDALANTGGKSLKPTTIGEQIAGTITSTDVRQATDYETGKPDFWDNGDPKLQIVVALETENGDEGAVYIKNWGAQRKALIEAITETGLDVDKALAPGNQFTMTYMRDEPNEKNPRLAGTKIYKFTITPAAPGKVADALGAPQQAPATATSQTQAAPAQAAPAQAAPAPAQAQQGGGATNIPALIAAGLTDDQIAAATGIDPTVIATVRANL